MTLDEVFYDLCNAAHFKATRLDAVTNQRVPWHRKDAVLRYMFP